jgi:uncharacterized protein DUF6551
MARSQSNRPIIGRPADTPQHFPTLQNKPGVFLDIPKIDLQVDPRYQRPLKKPIITRIADNWHWVACGTLQVSVRKDGYFLVDGQHRWEAAKLVSSIVTLPCMGYELKDIKEEATAFLEANSERTMPSAFSRFNALVVVGDQSAIIAKELIDFSGRRLYQQTGPGTISCISEIMRNARADADVLRRIWPLMTELSEGTHFSGTLLKGMFSLERRLDGHSLTETPIKAKLKSIGSDGLTVSIKNVALLQGSLNEKTAAEGILRALNHGARNRLSIK